MHLPKVLTVATLSASAVYSPPIPQSPQSPQSASVTAPASRTVDLLPRGNSPSHPSTASDTDNIFGPATQLETQQKEYLGANEAERLKGIRDAVAKFKAGELSKNEFLDLSQPLTLGANQAARLKGIRDAVAGKLSVYEYIAAQQTLTDKFGPAEPKSMLADSDPEEMEMA
jgi:hypothetical protein